MEILRLLIILALLVFPVAAFGQITIANSPFLYRPSTAFPDCDASTCFIDTVVPNQQHRDVPVRIRYPRGTTGPLPLILWSHGGGPDENGRVQNETWGRTLARDGYIVIHMSHFWSLEQLAAACLEFGVTSPGECGNNFPMGSLYRPRDANVVLGSLDFLEATFPELNNRIDRDRIAVAGWSYGSTTAMTLAGTRLRFSDSFTDVSFSNPLPKVFLALSPMAASEFGLKADSWREVTRPVLIATGASDYAGPDNPVNRRNVFQSVPSGQKYELYINHPAAEHTTFNLENADYPIFSQWLASYSLAYLDAKLKGNTLAGNYLISGRLPTFGSQKVVKLQRK